AVGDRLRRRDWAFLAALTLPAAMFAYFATHLSYGYAASKFLVLAWPLVCVSLTSLLMQWRHVALRGLGAACLLALVIVWQTRFQRTRPMGSPQLGESCWPEFRRLETLRPWLSTGGTLLAVSDHFA